MGSLHTDDVTLSRRLREVREALYGEYGVAALADALGIPPGTWENYEAGVRVPGPTLLAFIDLTGASPHWLATGEGRRFGD